MLYFIDKQAIEAAERISHTFQIMTGRTNFSIAKLIGVLATVYPAAALLYDHMGSLLEFILYFLGGMMLGFVVYRSFTGDLIKCDENKAMNNISKGFRNPDKINDDYRKRRVLFMITLAMIFIDLCEHTYSFITITYGIIWIGFVFKACDPLPPGNSKIKDWTNGIKAFFAKPATVSPSAFLHETLFYLQIEKTNLSSSQYLSSQTLLFGAGSSISGRDRNCGLSSFSGKGFVSGFETSNDDS